MGIRARKQQLLTSLKFRCQVRKMPAEQTSQFELMLRRARTLDEQDQVMAAFDHYLNHWKTGMDQWSRLLRDVNDVGDSPFLDEE